METAGPPEARGGSHTASSPPHLLVEVCHKASPVQGCGSRFYLFMETEKKWCPFKILYS